MPIKNKWYMIGVALEVGSADLDCLQDSKSSVEVNLANMIGKWLDTRAKQATWEVLLKAVEGKIVDNQQTGQDICKFLKIPERSDPHSRSERGRILYNPFTK